MSQYKEDTFYINKAIAAFDSIQTTLSDNKDSWVDGLCDSEMEDIEYNILELGKVIWYITFSVNLGSDSVMFKDYVRLGQAISKVEFLFNNTKLPNPYSMLLAHLEENMPFLLKVKNQLTKEHYNVV